MKFNSLECVLYTREKQTAVLGRKHNNKGKCKIYKEVRIVRHKVKHEKLMDEN